jgi:hypothetical protein
MGTKAAVVRVTTFEIIAECIHQSNQASDNAENPRAAPVKIEREKNKKK